MNSCDFCGTPMGVGKQSYRSPRLIVVPALAFVDNEGEWVACSDCSRLIEGKEWKALMVRAQRVNPGLRAANQEGKLRECSEFIASVWHVIFDQPTEVFFS